MSSSTSHTDNHQSANLIEQRLQLLDTIREIVDSELERRESRQRQHATAHPDLVAHLLGVCRSVGERMMRAFGVAE